VVTKVLVGVVALVVFVPVVFVSAALAVFGLGGDSPPVRDTADVPVHLVALLDADPAVVVDAVLRHPRIGLRPAARLDVARGAVDRRVLVVLLVVAEEHSLSWVGPFATGHSFYVHGTDRPSNHAFGRAVDVPMVDGKAVSPSNAAAAEVVGVVATLPPELRPDETGCPWPSLERLPGVFSDAAHDDHLHFGWDA
jgi:hypothetical protein